MVGASPIRAVICAALAGATVAIGLLGAADAPARGGGNVFGFADFHLHITADMRAGGKVIYGRAFSPGGPDAALGHDENDHGPNGALDVTGNLLRTGLPVGTHDTDGWPTFDGWPAPDTYTHQQVYWRWLRRAWRSGERLVVAQTVEDQPLCRLEPLRSHSCDEMDTIKLEIARLRAMQDYIDRRSAGRGQGWFRIVTSPNDARRVIQQGKLAVVIGMEASNPFGCSEFEGVPQCTRADIDSGLREFHRLGLRSMFIAHWVDNALAGAAFEGGAKGQFISAMEVEQTGHAFRSEPCETADESGGRCNVKGLTNLGAYLVRQLVASHMLIDVDHLSQKARRAVMAIAERHDYPVISSHTGTGGEWTHAQLRRLYADGGLASATLGDPAALAQRIVSFKQDASPNHYFGVGLGSDTGGFNALPGPPPDADTEPLLYPFTSYDGTATFHRETMGQRTWDLNTDGVAHYGLVPDLLADTLRQPDGEEAERLLFRSAEAYLQMWAQAHAG